MDVFHVTVRIKQNIVLLSGNIFSAGVLVLLHEADINIYGNVFFRRNIPLFVIVIIVVLFALSEEILGVQLIIIRKILAGTQGKRRQSALSIFPRRAP